MQIINIELLFLLIIITITLLFKTVILKSIHKEYFEDICKSKLSDREYLEHMIHHHQIAIDMS